MKNIFIILFLSIIVQSCSFGDVKQFTDEEQSYVEKSELYNDCKMNVDKDYEVVKNDSKNGHLYILLDFTNSKKKLCLHDSTEVAEKIIPFAVGFEKIMDKRSHYDSLTIEVSIMNRKTPDMESLSCGKYFDFALNNMKRFKYREFKK